MAKKKNTRADKAVSAGKPKEKKNTAQKSSAKSKPKATNKQPKVRTEYDQLSSSAITAIISLILFILFLVICINPEGKLMVVINSFLTGLVGRAGFYFSVPALLYLFLINAFGRKKAVAMRSVCTILFVFSCGCIYHLAVQTQGMATGMALFPDLYLGGIDGRGGGVLCGGIAYLLRWAFGAPVSYIIIGLAVVITLLGALDITIPSLIHAIINRPRDDWEDEEQEDVYIEPAAVVVNHITNKQIARKHQRREKEAAKRKQIADTQPEQKAELTAPKAKKQVKEPDNRIPAPEPLHIPNTEHVQLSSAKSAVTGQSENTPSRASGVMSTIDLDIDAPVFPTSKRKNPPKSIPKPATPVRVTPEEDFGDTVVIPEPETVRPLPEITRPVPETKQAAPEPQKTAAVETKPGKVTEKDAQESAKQVALEIQQGSTPPNTAYRFPPVELLKRPLGGTADGTEEMRENSRRLNETLASFHIDAHIINVTRGPSVTRYEVELDKGVRLNKLTNCADDIALSLGASGVRIAAVPGKISIVGIEVPNRAVTTVSLREVIDSPEFGKAKSKSSFAVGKDIGGSCIVGNISKMPHMLIAGTTGSGKSVCMNSIIISLLYKSGPEDVKLIMVDPKMVELGIYNGIPHLLIPVVTDPKKAAGSLQWAVTEMLRRYKLMSDVGVRDLESYNAIVTAEEGGQKLPQVVIIIDELADLMLVAAKEVEDSICRIAQMGRAAGMHLIIATQRPSADVITGLMKANIPSRIAFSVASAMESRIILDTQGAEKLVGKGDMLYAPIGIGKPLRVQGCFVTDSEVESIAGYVKEHYVADYSQEVLQEIEQKAQQTGNSKGSKSATDVPEPTAAEEDGDEMLPAAVDVILETGQASVSMLQRRLKLGYARAARIVDEMEEKGIVGPFQGSKPRAILVTKEQWAAMRGGESQLSIDFDEDSSIQENTDLC